MSTHWKTLRFRLALWNACTVLVTATLVLIGLRQGVYWAILHEMDQILIEDAEEVALAIQDLPAIGFEQFTEELNRKAIGHRHHAWFVQLVGPDGRLVWSSLAAPVDLPFPPDTTPVPYTVENRRLVQRFFSTQPAGIAMIRVGVTLTLLQQDMATIDRLVLLMAAALLFLAPLLGYWLAGRAARSIGQIIQTASRLRPDHLDERLPVSGTEDELDRLAVTVNRLLDRIAESLRQKQDFLANAAHELRTPLAAIRSSIEVALVSRRTPPEYEELLHDIIDQGATLERLVNQLLLISESEVEQWKTLQEQVSLDELVHQSVEMLTPVAEIRGIELQAHIAPRVSVRGRRHLLRQVVNNLIDNALKYTPCGGHVNVELDLTDAGRIALLTVRDTGIGIDPEDLPHVFDRFFRSGRSRSRSTADVADDVSLALDHVAGTGLGLSICQAVVLAHRGNIQCTSSPGAGTTMTVQLPTDSTE